MHLRETRLREELETEIGRLREQLDKSHRLHQEGEKVSLNTAGVLTYSANICTLPAGTTQASSPAQVEAWS